MKHLARAISSLLLLAFSILNGCASSSITLDVKAYRDPEISFSGYKTFNIVSVNQNESLLNKEILHLATQKLLKRGLTLEKEKPDLFVFLNHYIGPYEYYVPPSISYIPVYKPGEKKTYSGYIGGMSYFGTEKSNDKLELQAVRREGYTATAYYRNISLFIADVNEYQKTGQVKFIWEGTADSGGSSSDLITVAPYLLAELIGEFPSRSGKPTTRTVWMTPTTTRTTTEHQNTKTQQVEIKENEYKTKLPAFRTVVTNTEKFSDQQILESFRKKYSNLKNKSDTQLIQLIEITYSKKLQEKLETPANR